MFNKSALILCCAIIAPTVVTAAEEAQAPEKEKKVQPAPAVPATEIPPATWPVSGIYTAPDTKDLGALSGIGWLSGVKARDRKSTRLNSSHIQKSRMPSSA